MIDENGRDLSTTAGYVDQSIVADANDSLVELKDIIEVLDYGVEFPKP